MRTTQLRPIAAFTLAIATLAPSTTSAQWRYPPLYPPYGGYRYAVPESSVRFKVTPSDASVYVDGYFAGKVDEFDGRFQRLHVAPGEHEIVVHLEGYRSLRQRLYLSPNSTRTVEGDLEKLAAGEAQDPVPEPSPADRIEPRDDGGPMPPRAPLPRRTPPGQPPTRRAPGTEPPAPSRFASLSIRVQPSGTMVRIDGEQWDGPSGSERLIVQVAEGRHVIEVQREGYEPFTTEVEVRRGETTPLNISLRRR